MDKLIIHMVDGSQMRAEVTDGYEAGRVLSEGGWIDVPIKPTGPMAAAAGHVPPPLPASRFQKPPILSINGQQVTRIEIYPASRT